MNSRLVYLLLFSGLSVRLSLNNLGQFENFLNEKKYGFDIKLIVADPSQEESLYSLKTCLDDIGGGGLEDLIVIFGDNIFSFDLMDFVEAQRRHPQRSMVAVYEDSLMDMSKPSQYGLVNLKKDLKVIRRERDHYQKLVKKHNLL